MKKILVIGGTGFIGSDVVKKLAKLGKRIRVVSRGEPKFNMEDRLGSLIEFYKFDLMTGPLPKAAFEDVEIVVSLIGAPIAAKRWTREYKNLILHSRVQGTKNIVEGIKSVSGIKKFISISGIGYYGDQGDEFIEASSKKGDGFLAEVCDKWEKTALILREKEINVTIIRTANVVGNGGFLDELKKIAKFGVLTWFGSGKQFFPWVKLEDLTEIMIGEIEQMTKSKIINAVSGGPIRQKTFFIDLAKQWKVKFCFGVPKVLAVLAKGELAKELFKSQRVVKSEKIID